MEHFVCVPIRSSDTVSHCSHLHSGPPAGSSPHRLCVPQRLTFTSLVKFYNENKSRLSSLDFFPAIVYRIFRSFRQQTECFLPETFSGTTDVNDVRVE